MKNADLALAIACLLISGQTRGAGETARPPLVHAGEKGLEYGAEENGDRIPDFSHCGYGGGGVSLPDVTVKMTVEPVNAGDDAERIQAAIDRVAGLAPDRDGFRGAVLLKAGTYRVAGTLRIRESGVVLRGAGPETGGTVIVATGMDKRALLHVDGGKPGTEIRGSRRTIADERVPVGATQLRLTTADGLATGDSIGVFRPGTDAWIRALGTDQLNRGPKDDVKNWTPDSYAFAFERRIVSVAANAITIDAPIVFAIEPGFGGGSVYTTSPDERIHKVGIEQLRLISEYRRGEERTDEAHAWDAILIGNLADGWVRNVTAVHFGYSSVNIGPGGKRITVQDCACLDPVSKISGGRRYSFALDGQLCVVQRCYTRGGRHDYVMHARARGPNVFLDCVADQAHSDSGPHHRWATGTLYDNIACGALNVQWRGRSGTGHGWAGANMVFWNCRAATIDCQKPPTANNYCIGCTGKIRGSGHMASPGKPVFPRSLYLRQLEDRLGLQAVKNVTIQEQRTGTIDELLRRQLSR